MPLASIAAHFRPRLHKLERPGGTLRFIWLFPGGRESFSRSDFRFWPWSDQPGLGNLIASDS